MLELDVDTDWPRVLWIGAGIVLSVVLLLVIYRFIGTFVFGVFIYYATRRIHRRVENYVRPPSLAAAVSLLVIALPALILLYATLSVAVDEFNQFSNSVNGVERSERFEQLFNLLGPQANLEDILTNPRSILEFVDVQTLLSTFDTVSSSVAVVGTGLLHVFVMLALAFYLLRDGPRLHRWCHQFTEPDGVLQHYADEVDESFDKVFYGNILNAAITGLIGGVSFTVLDVFSPAGISIPYPALTGLVTGIASLIPVVGMKLVYVPLVAYLGLEAGNIGHGWWFVALVFLVAFFLVDAVPDFVVRPYVSGGTLHTGMLMFAYIFGPLLWGWYGLFLGPMLLVLVVHFARIVLPELIAGSRVRPYAVDPTAVVGSDEPIGPKEADDE